MSNLGCYARHLERPKTVPLIRITRRYLKGRGPKVEKSLNRTFGFKERVIYDPWKVWNI